MLPLTLDDVLPLEEYAGRRGEFFASHQRYLDRYRRVRIGPRATLLFENRQTLWFRVQELLRITRLTEPYRVQQELDWYNRLMPQRRRLQAVLLITPSDDLPPSCELSDWPDLHGEQIVLELASAFVGSMLVTARPGDLAVGMAHWLEFSCDEEARAALGDFRQPARFAIHRDDYDHASVLLGDEIRQSLLDDLALSDRDR